MKYNITEAHFQTLQGPIEGVLITSHLSLNDTFLYKYSELNISVRIICYVHENEMERDKKYKWAFEKRIVPRSRISMPSGLR